MNLSTSTHALHFRHWWIHIWNSIQTKENCAYEYYLEHPMKAELTTVCSGYIIPERRLMGKWSLGGCFSSIEIQLPSLLQEAEADMRIITHLYWALSFEYNSFVVLMNDTDVLISLLRYSQEWNWKNLNAETYWKLT